MRLRDRIRIDAPVEAVWPFVADPALMSLWNPKVVSVDRDSGGPVRLGERFSMTYRMSGRDRQTEVEVVECREPCALTIRHRPEQWTPDRFIDESYQFSASARGTKLVQCIDLSYARIPLVFRILMWLIQQLGTPTGTPYLRQLKDLVEQCPEQGV